MPNQWLISTKAWGRADDGDGSALDVPLRTTLLRNYAHELGIFELQSAMCFPVWKSTPGLGGPHETSELSSSVTSTSIRLIFGRIDGSRRVLEAPQKTRVETVAYAHIGVGLKISRGAPLVERREVVDALVHAWAAQE